MRQLPISVTELTFAYNTIVFIAMDLQYFLVSAHKT